MEIKKHDILKPFTAISFRNNNFLFFTILKGKIKNSLKIVKLRNKQNSVSWKKLKTANDC